MSQITCGGLPVASGELVFPLRGAWSARLEVVARTAAEVIGVDPDASILSAEGSVVVRLGSTELRGYATAEADKAERVTVRLVGGAGGLDEQIAGKHFRSQSRRVVLTDALDAGGERLSATSADLDATLSQWTRMAGTVGEALRALTEPAGLTWRVLADGTVWVGTETWPAVTAEHVLTREEPAKSRLILAVEGAGILPGSTFLGRRVTGVTYSIAARAIRATVSYGDTTDPIASAIGTIVRRETARLDFYASYEARVVGQNADETLELQPADPRLRGMSRIPIRPGMAGVTSQTVPSGSTALVKFANGDPARAYVAGFVGASATAITFDAIMIKLGELATAGAARGDLVESELAAIAADLHTHTHPVAGAVAGASTTSSYAAGLVSSTKVFIQ